eukprot:SAG22_NODE_1096_length_5579_cov_5.298175_6_plen_97_part_00
MGGWPSFGWPSFGWHGREQSKHVLAFESKALKDKWMAVITKACALDPQAEEQARLAAALDKANEGRAFKLMPLQAAADPNDPTAGDGGDDEPAPEQ